MQAYQHLSNEERFYIWNALRNGSSQKAVAEEKRKKKGVKYHIDAL